MHKQCKTNQKQLANIKSTRALQQTKSKYTVRQQRQHNLQYWPHEHRAWGWFTRKKPLYLCDGLQCQIW